MKTIITSHKEAQDLLTGPESIKIGAVVSISDIDCWRPTGLFDDESKLVLCLTFSDVIVGRHAPQKSDIQELIDILPTMIEKCERENKDILVHCAGGICRSTASAFVAMCMKLPEGMEDVAIRQILEWRHIADPNRRIVELADEILGRKGRMIKALEDVQDEINRRMRIEFDF